MTNTITNKIEIKHYALEYSNENIYKLHKLYRTMMEMKIIVQ